LSDPIKSNMSMMNPVDMAAMKQESQMGQGPMAGLSPNTTVREFLGKLGVDVDGPVSQLQKLVQDQVQKANPVSKMSNIANNPAPGGGGGQAPPPMPDKAGLDALM